MSHPDSQPQPDAWRSCCRNHAAALLLYARQWLPCRADAEDAVQAGFVKFWKTKPAPREEDVPLLYACVRSAALDLLKQGLRRDTRERSYTEEQEQLWWDADTLAERERAMEIQRMLQELRADQREVIVLRLWADMTFAQIAESLGESINTVSGRYRYALSNLKKLLSEECHERIGA